MLESLLILNDNKLTKRTYCKKIAKICVSPFKKASKKNVYKWKLIYEKQSGHCFLYSGFTKTL